MGQGIIVFLSIRCQEAVPNTWHRLPARFQMRSHTCERLSELTLGFRGSTAAVLLPLEDDRNGNLIGCGVW